MRTRLEVGTTRPKGTSHVHRTPKRALLAFAGTRRGRWPALVVCVGVLLDAIVVRSLLVPALALRIGDRLWRPGRIVGRRAATREPEPQEASV